MPSRTITVARGGGDGGSVSVDYATGNGTATTGTDYTATTGTLNFADGVDSQTFTIPILNDGSDDGSETVNLTLSSPTGGATLGTQSTAVLTINDSPGSLQFSAPTYSVVEGTSSA